MADETKETTNQTTGGAPTAAPTPPPAPPKRKFILDGVEYPDPGPDVTPEQFRDLMVTFFPELSNAEMTMEKTDEHTVYRWKKRVGTKG
jgi:PRTRC genetic system protein C